MPRPRRARSSSRRTPTQARSTQLVADILQASIRVLERHGPHRFTTIRVAETAGVSIGSLYQYFPNKQAILERLQLDEYEQTGAMIEAILANAALAPSARLRELFRAFFQSECDEAPLRLALAAAVPSYNDSIPNPRTARSLRIVSGFLIRAAPRASPRERRFAAQLLFLTMTAVGKQVSELRPSPAELHRFADASADMLALYLAQLGA